MSYDFSFIGVRIDPDSPKPEFYTILVHRDGDLIPPILDGRIVFFHRPELLESVIVEFFPELSDREVGRPEGPDVVCDVAWTLYMIQSESHDPDATIVNCLNMLFEWIEALAIELPEACRSALYRFADHLTFDREYDEFLIDQGIDRREIIDGIRWCIGAIVLMSSLRL